VTALTIARLTIREASRRRLLLALVVLTLVVIGLTGWGFQRITTFTDRSGKPISDVQVKLISSQLLILVMFMFSGVLALSSVFVASPAISGELESGVALAVVSRPVRRAEILLGKWLGLAVLVLVYTLGSSLLEVAVVRIATGYAPPHPFQMLAYLLGEGLILLTLALLFSTRMSGMTGGIIAVVMFFMAWMGGIAGGIGAAFNNDTITHVGTVSRLLLPTDGLWRGAVYSLEPESFLALQAAAGRAIGANPFFAANPPPLTYDVWVAAWLALMLGAAVWSFNRREV
jgi:ABC-type transport system involved in multi-copper enzyme maturation permease subunit